MNSVLFIEKEYFASRNISCIFVCDKQNTFGNVESNIETKKSRFESAISPWIRDKTVPSYCTYIVIVYTDQLDERP